MPIAGEAVDTGSQADLLGSMWGSGRHTCVWPCWTPLASKLPKSALSLLTLILFQFPKLKAHLRVGSRESCLLIKQEARYARCCIWQQRLANMQPCQLSVRWLPGAQGSRGSPAGPGRDPWGDIKCHPEQGHTVSWWDVGGQNRPIAVGQKEKMMPRVKSRVGAQLCSKSRPREIRMPRPSIQPSSAMPPSWSLLSYSPQKPQLRWVPLRQGGASHMARFGDSNWHTGPEMVPLNGTCVMRFPGWALSHRVAWHRQDIVNSLDTHTSPRPTPEGRAVVARIEDT